MDSNEFENWDNTARAASDGVKGYNYTQLHAVFGAVLTEMYGAYGPVAARILVETAEAYLHSLQAQYEE